MKHNKSQDQEPLGAKHKLPDGVRIPDIGALNDALADGNEGFAVLLAGGIVFSRKTINRNGNKYHVVNHIDESEQTLTRRQLLSIRHTIIGSAMKGGALVTLGNCD